MNTVVNIPNAFKLHSETGVPLSIQLMLGQPRQVFARFYFDALFEGWKSEYALSLIEASARDNDLEFDSEEFMLKVRHLVNQKWNEGFRDPEIWKVCSESCF